MTGPADFRLALKAAGFTPVACIGKRPVLPGWQDIHDPTVEEIGRWPGGNTGINTRDTPVIDFDITHPAAAARAGEVVRDWFEDRGALLTRFGALPKFAIPFRTRTPFQKIRADFTAPDGSHQAIEVLGEGQQVIVAGIHPVTDKPYRWHADYAPGQIKREDLPEVDEKEMREVLTLISEMLVEEFGFKAAARSNGYTADASPFAVLSKPGVDPDAALASIRFGNIHDTWKDCMGSLLRSGMPADAVMRKVLDATEASPGCQDDPKKEEWASSLGEFLEWYVRNDPTLLPSLPVKMQVAWHRLTNAGERPKLVYRSDRIMYVRNANNNVKPRIADGAQEEAPRHEAPDAPKQREAPRVRFKLVPFVDLNLGTDPLYLVDELIPIRGLVDLWGKAKCCKSFWAYDLCFHIAMGWEYRDRPVQQGTVVYCAFEGAHGYKKRKEALLRHYNIPREDPVPLYLVAETVNLITEHAILIAAISGQLGDSDKPAVVVLDTLNKSLVGSENKDVDMGAYVRAAEAIRDAFDCVVIIVHHCGYDETRPRGHSSLPAAVDAQLAVTRQGDVVTVTVEMMRDGPEETQIVSEVKQVDVGTDRNGKTLTSLVVVPSDADAATRERKDWPRSLSVFHAAVKSSLASHGEMFQPEAGVLPVRAVDLNFVRERFYATYAEAEEDEKKRTGKLRQAFHRVVGEAQKRGVIQSVHTEAGRTMVWLPGQGA